MQIINDSTQTRRLQLVGGSTYVVSLPKGWVDDLEFEAGSYVSLTRNPNRSITLFRDGADGRVRAVTVVAKGDSKESIRRKIIAIYLAGYNIIEVKTRGMEIHSSHRGIIRDLVRTTLMGTEIIEASSERIVLQVLTQLSQLPFSVVLRRMHITATNMHRDAVRALKELDTDYGDEVVKMDDEVDRFSLYMMRNLNLALENIPIMIDSGLEKPSECMGYRVIVKCVERIADHGALIAKKIKYLKAPVDRRIIREMEAISNKSLEIFESSMTALAKRDYLMAENVASNVYKVIEREEKLMDGLRQDGNVATLKLILEDIRRTAEYSSDIAEAVMDGAVQTVITEA